MRRIYLVLASILFAVPAAVCSAPDRPPVVLLPRATLDSMTAVFSRFNEHWNELGDLNTLEKMLGTVRPTQREYLGCLQGSVAGDTIRVDGWTPAANMKQLQLAVAGSCDSVARLIGTWHTHPYRADLQNLPIKEPHLSPQDLETFTKSSLTLTLVVWDADSIDAAVRDGSAIVHPAVVVVSPP